MIFTITKWMEILNYLYVNEHKKNNYISNIAKGISINISFDYTFKVIKTLKKNNLVKNVEIDTGGRTKHLELTMKGKELAESCYNVIKIKNELMK